MDPHESAYRRLQRHLDTLPVGFPATRSGAGIKVLKHIFTPREAEIACCLSGHPEPLEIIFRRAGSLVRSFEELEVILDAVHRKGGIESRFVEGRRVYCNIPLVVGMYEMQIGRLTPEFVRDFNAYSRDLPFGIEFLATELPQLRTIPVARSIQPHHQAATFDEVFSLIELSEAPFAVLECICRRKRTMEGRPCKITSRAETCLALGGIAESVLLSGHGREATRGEVLAILERNQEEGLVLQPSNTQKADFICSCCGCCCGMLDVHSKLPKPLDFWSSNFQAAVDETACDGCGACEKRCQVRAVTVSAERGVAEVDRNRCIGCGICVPTCPGEALSLFKKAGTVTPPGTREELYEIIGTKKKGRLGKWKLTGKLVLDALCTGRMDLLGKLSRTSN